MRDLTLLPLRKCRRQDGHAVDVLPLVMPWVGVRTEGRPGSANATVSSANHRYLVDASGQPFLLISDSAWSCPPT